jgi:SagB-type dehydrogenase family enzyme
MDSEQKNIENLIDRNISELFHENTKQRRSDFQFIQRIISTMIDPTFKSITAQSYKHYSSGRKIMLSPSFPKAIKSFDRTLLSRRSVRTFSNKPLSILEVSKVIFFSNGITETSTVDNNEQTKQNFRTCPSAGALYPIEIYVIALNINDLPTGIYHYNARENSLESVSLKDTREHLANELKNITFTEEVGSAPAIIVLTGIPSRSKVKYGERGYRFALMEAGHICQNILLTATSLNLNSFPIGGFIDDELNQLLKIDGLEEMSLYIIPIGKRPNFK